MCLNILREDWKPVLTINSIVYGLQYLFLVCRKLFTLNTLSLSIFGIFGGFKLACDRPQNWCQKNAHHFLCPLRCANESSSSVLVQPKLTCLIGSFSLSLSHPSHKKRNRIRRIRSTGKRRKCCKPTGACSSTMFSKRCAATILARRTSSAVSSDI